jgi:hypothetical protein
LFTSFIGSFCFAQQSLVPQNVNEWSQTLSLEVLISGEPVVFSTAADYGGSKTFPGYYRLHVKAPPMPWVITATVKDMYTTVTQDLATGDMAHLVSLRCESCGYSVRLSSTPQVILQSSNTLPENDYVIDLIADPPFNVPSGNYVFMVSFQIALQ